MTWSAPAVPRLVWFLGLAGALTFLAALGSPHEGLLTFRHIEAAVALAVLVHLMWNVDPAWLLSGGLACSIFSGNWKLLGFGSTLVPDRVLFGAGLVALVFRFPPARNRPQITLRPVHAVLGLAVVYVAMSGFLTGGFDDKSGFFRLLDSFGIVPFVMFAIAPVAFRTARQRTILLGTLIAVGAYLGLTALFEALKLHSLIWPRYITDPSVGIHQGRGRGPFLAADANGMALYACGVAAVIGLVLSRRRGLRPRFLLLLAAIAMLDFSGAFFTLTRSVWLGSVVASVATLVAVRGLRRYLVPVGVAGAVVVLGALAVIPGLASEASHRQHDQRPVWDRENGNLTAVRMLEAQPLLGFGWNEFVPKSIDYYRQQPNFPMTSVGRPLHNALLSNLVELGIIGGGIWVAGLLMAVGGGIVRRGPPDVRPWRVGLVAVAVQWAIVSSFAPAAFAFPNALLWAWAGVLWVGADQRADGLRELAHSGLRRPASLSRPGRSGALAAPGGGSTERRS
jgi:putative inorganic carbon (hco3(-)) transporter